MTHESPIKGRSRKGNVQQKVSDCAANLQKVADGVSP
jgi:hypothetical protein